MRERCRLSDAELAEAKAWIEELMKKYPERVEEAERGLPETMPQSARSIWRPDRSGWS